jgi:hypothetical protein
VAFLKSRFDRGLFIADRICRFVFVAMAHGAVSQRRNCEQESVSVWRLCRRRLSESLAKLGNKDARGVTSAEGAQNGAPLSRAPDSAQRTPESGTSVSSIRGKGGSPKSTPRGSEFAGAMESWGELDDWLEYFTVVAPSLAST